MAETPPHDGPCSLDNGVGRIIPLPRVGRDDGQRWDFTAEVRSVSGPEGQWLRRELSGVVRELLTWARDDMPTPGQVLGDGEERAA
jgi:hypothetical protein